MGSQIQKNILDDIKLGLDKDNKPYVYTDKNGNEIEGAALLQRIHNAVSQLSNIGQRRNL